MLQANESWYAPLAALESKGSQVDPVGGLAGLAAARELHQGQFFTPLVVVQLMWDLVGLTDAPEPVSYGGSRGRWQIFDGAFGSGRMFALADPELHALHGIEVDAAIAEQVISTATGAGFATDLHVGSMVDYQLAESSSSSGWYGGSSSRQRFHVGLINPPFSLHFDSPNVAKWPDIATFGKYGANSATQSQRLAVAQALAWCEVVAAVVPRTFADAYVTEEGTRRDRWSHERRRLRAVYHLPRSAFRAEGAEVDTSVMVWGEHAVGAHDTVTLRDMAEARDVHPVVRLEYTVAFPRLARIDAPDDGPAKLGRAGKALARLIERGRIDAPIGARWVKLSHDGRRITVSASDAATYVRALNYILDSWVGNTEHRRVKAAVYAGQGRLDVECFLAQPSPTDALHELLNNLALHLDAQASASPDLLGYLLKRARQHAVDVTPFGHTALVEDGGFADWLAAQTETVRVRFKPDAMTPYVHEHHEPGRKEPCPRCDDADDDEAAECWQCKGTREVDASVVRQLCQLVRSMKLITATRSARREHGRDKEDRSERHWDITYSYEAGRGRVIGPCNYCHGNPNGHPWRHCCGGLGVELADADETGAKGEVNDAPVAVLIGRAAGRWSEAELIERCEFPDFSPLPNEWTRVHPGLAEHFPERHKNALARARRLGIDKWLWSYQLQDLCEVSMKRGAIIAWEMGLGKARLAAALCLLGGGKHNLITVESRLIKEMEAEFKAIGLPRSSWQTITKPEHARALRQINLISYDKLKAVLPGKKRPKPITDAWQTKGLPEVDREVEIEVATGEKLRGVVDSVDARTGKFNLMGDKAVPAKMRPSINWLTWPAAGVGEPIETRVRWRYCVPATSDKPRTRDLRHTYAGLLRRRVHTHVCDEGHLLRAPATQQSRAVHHVSAKGRRYLLTGTPIANYPRDVLWLLQWALGDGTAAQTYGNHYPLMRPENLHDYGSAPRGVDEFREQFVTLRWVTNEFADEMQEGAKREVPVIADVPGFRKVVRHVIKRRVSAEPEVAQHVRIPVPERVVVPVDWDSGHFAYYQRTVQTFVDWYLAEQERLIRAGERDGEAKAMRLIAILQQLMAVFQAANFPQGGVGGQPAWKGGDTSKQRLAVDTAAQWVAEGHKVITYSRSPALAAHVAVRLRARDIDTVEFHGGITLAKRVKALDERFRDGKAQVLAATKGCLQTGYNLACASRVLHIDGEWTPSVVQQADARVLRPQQRRDVLIHYLDLRGSIDDYQRQMVQQKGSTMAAGLDYGAGPGPDAEFRHFDSILGQFVADFQASVDAAGASLRTA